MRELVINIKADGAPAKRELAAVEGKLQDVTAGASEADKAFEQTFKVNLPKVLGVAAAAIAALDIGQMVDEAVDGASRLADAAARMGIGAEAMQKLKFAAEQGGASLGAVGTAIRTMADHLSDGDKGTVKLLGDLGLSLDTLRQMKPEEAFLAIIDKVREIPDPMRQSAAMTDLFGRTSAELLPAVKAGFREVGDQAPLMRDAVVEAGDRSGDAIHRLEEKIGVMRANALIPLVDWFTTHLPESVQTGIAAVGTFIPSLESIALAVLAAGGPKAALAGLSTFFLTTLPGAIGGFIAGAGTTVVTFFTVTIPAAFGAVVAFLGPQGLLIVAALAMYAAWKLWGDDITAVAKRVYEGVKTWLVDKFEDIKRWVGEKIGAIKGYFADMYDAVVGHSYVPDMIDEIAAQFGRLDDVMVAPTDRATTSVMTLFEDGYNGVRSVLREFQDENRSVWDNVVGYVSGGAQAATGVMRVMSGDIRGVVDIVIGSVKQIMSAIGLAKSAWHGLQSLFGTDEEARDVNPRRDAFLSQWGDPSIKGVGGAGHNLAALLTSLGAGESGGSLFSALQEADKMPTFTAAVDDVLSFLSDHGVNAVRGFATGTQGRLLDFGPEGELVKLHNREQVVTEGEARHTDALLGRIASHLSEQVALLRSIKSDNATMPLLLKAAVQQGRV